MTVADLIEKIPVRPVSLNDPGRSIDGVFAGDLLSWVMGKAQSGQILVTIMTNNNVIAVASLIDLAAVVICDGAIPDEVFLQKANENDVNVLCYSGSSFEMCAALCRLGL